MLYYVVQLSSGFVIFSEFNRCLELRKVNKLTVPYKIINIADIKTLYSPASNFSAISLRSRKTYVIIIDVDVIINLVDNGIQQGTPSAISRLLHSIRNVDVQFDPNVRVVVAGRR